MTEGDKERKMTKTVKNKKTIYYLIDKKWQKTYQVELSKMADQSKLKNCTK